MPLGLDQDRFNQLRLIRSANIGPVTYLQLMQRYGSAAAALEAIPDLAGRGRGKTPRIAAVDRIEEEVAAVHAMGGSYVFLGEAAYPALLAQIGNPAPALICQGRLDLLEKPVVAIVGARNASAAACRFAKDLANGLSAQGVSVVSGLARGIDTAAHEGSLAAGTVAVNAGGIDVYYPPENEPLQRSIADHGLLLAEQPPGTEPRARHFPYRNRIIAGLARGTVVVEAAPKSGSLITARMAAEAGRHVMAIPGSPLDPRSRGCNALIREGANLVQSVDDILELVLPFDERADATRTPAETGAGQVAQKPVIPVSRKQVPGGSRQVVTGLLSRTPVMIDEVIRQSQVDAAMVQLVLLELELAGRLSRHAGAKVSLKS